MLGGWLDSMILEVFFNLRFYDSVIPGFYDSVLPSSLLPDVCPVCFTVGLLLGVRWFCG